MDCTKLKLQSNLTQQFNDYGHVKQNYFLTADPFASRS